MKSQQLLFYLTGNDTKDLFESLKIPIVCYRTGLFDTPEIPKFKSMKEIPNLGNSLFGDWNKIDDYLIQFSDEPLIIRDIQQRNGEVKYAVDQMKNLNSVTIRFGGIYGENVIIGGRLATISNQEKSKQIFKEIALCIKKSFLKTGAYFLGKHANELLHLGWRLTTNDKSPKEYDLLP